LPSPKLFFDEVEKAMCQVVARQLELIFFLLNNPKCDMGEVDKAMFQEPACQSELIFGILIILKETWLTSRNRCFMSSHGVFNILSASGPAQNATWVNQ